MKTLAIRFEDEQHARLTVLARIREVSVTDAIRTAIEAHITAVSQDPDVTAKVQALAADIERDAQEQQAALQSLFGTEPAATPRSRSKN